MPYRAITLSGEVGSGKSSLAHELEARLPGWRRVNTGQRFREFCAARRSTIQEVSHLPDEVHREFDAAQAELLHSGSHLIVEGRLAGWLARDLPDVFRIYCSAPLSVRVERYMERDHPSAFEAASEVNYRDDQDLEKYRRIYGLTDYRDATFYSLVLDTSKQDPAELAERVLREAGLAVESR